MKTHFAYLRTDINTGKAIEAETLCGGEVTRGMKSVRLNLVGSVAEVTCARCRKAMSKWDAEKLARCTEKAAIAMALP